MATLLDYMSGTGISSDRALSHIAAGMVRVDGERVDDPGVEVRDKAVVNIHLPDTGESAS